MPWKRSRGKRPRVDDTDDDSDSRPRNKPKSSNSGTTTKRQVDDEGNSFWELGGRLRRVTISNFKGSVYVNIREHYEKDGKVLPGKKGILLSVNQFNAMMKVLPQLHLTLSKEAGAEIVTPEFDSPILKVKENNMRDEKSNSEEEDNVRKQTPERNQKNESGVATRKEKVQRKRVVSSGGEDGEDEEDEEYQENRDLAAMLDTSS